MKTKNDLRTYIRKFIEISYLYQQKKYDEEILACYTETDMYLEAFSRSLWGILWEKNSNNIPLEVIRSTILNGTNKNSIYFWGKLTDYSQKIVELPVVVMCLYQFREEIWNTFSKEEKKQIYDWFATCDTVVIPNNNWCFFRILIHLFFYLLGMGDKPSVVCKNDFNIIESLYIGNGWYSDGNNKQRDYYIAFAFHYYGLLYAYYAKEIDFETANRYRDRATLFANEYIYWFSCDGSNIPFGRSLIYRFATLSFWCAVVFADVPCNYSKGVIKGIIYRGLRWWKNQDILTDKKLTLGYTYPNMFMAEEYNSSYSPYWCLKIAILLGIEDNDSFWEIEEAEMPMLNAILNSPKSLSVTCRDLKGKHVALFPYGQMSEQRFCQSIAKYGKYVYSNLFGFSVSRSTDNFEASAYDNVASVSLDNVVFWPCTSYSNGDNVDGYNKSKSYPINGGKDVQIETTIIPGLPWHVRIHQIKTKKEIFLSDGGFSIPDTSKIQENKEYVQNDKLISGAVSLIGNGVYKNCHAATNTNILYPRTIFPVIKYHFYPGEYTIIDTFCGECLDDFEKFKHPCIKSINGKKLILILNDKEYKVLLKKAYRKNREKLSMFSGKVIRFIKLHLKKR